MSFIVVDNVRMHYTMGSSQTGDGARMLMVHGFGGSGRHFRRVIPLMKCGIVPIAIDLPGHGRSGGALPDSPVEVAAVLQGCLDVLGVSEPVWYVGHSLGAYIGLKFAARFSNRVRGLVVIAGAARLRLHPDLAAQAESGCWDLRSFHTAFGSDVRDQERRMSLQDLPRLRLKSGRETLQRFMADDAGEDIAAIQAPTLVMVPEGDVILSPRHGKALAASIQSAAVVLIRNAGHYVHVEQPRVVADHINAFVGSRSERLVHDMVRSDSLVEIGGCGRVCRQPRMSSAVVGPPRGRL